MHCLDCDYDLHHNDTGRCPECGRAFNRFDPDTYGHAPIERRREGRFALAFAVVAALVVGSTILFLATWLTTIAEVINAIAGDP